MSGKLNNPAEVAAALADAIRDRGASIPDLMVGAAAFIAAIIYKSYTPAMWKQIVVTHANTVLDMVERVEETVSAEELEREEIREEVATAKKWVQ